MNVSRESTLEEIRSSYKSLVKKYHPDVSKEDDKEKLFVQITKAYSVLKDENLRVEYNEQLRSNKRIQTLLGFQYSLFGFIKKQGELFNSFRIFFKNISGKKKEKLDSNDFFSWQWEVQEEVLKMSVSDLEERLLYSDNVFVKINAAAALGFKAEKSAYFSLEKVLSDPNNEVKKSAIWAIGNLKMKKSLPVLKILFESGAFDVKIEILKAIYKIEEGKGAYFYKFLISAINDRNIELEKTGLKLLLLIDGKILFDDIKEIFQRNVDEIKLLLDNIIAENKIINFPGVR